jgi:tRNA (guanine-N7-)-methyltransferase
MSRIRHHVNPLNFKKELKPLNLEDTFNNNNPVDLEIGSGFGKFLIEKAIKNPERNIVGLEIRLPLVEEVAIKIKEKNLKNVIILNASINQHVDILFSENSIENIYLFFPDPWFKKRHVKRRVINKTLIGKLNKIQKKEANLYVWTDVEKLMIYMDENINESKSYIKQYPSIYNLTENPIGIKTRFELKKEQFMLKIFRQTYRNNGDVK